MRFSLYTTVWAAGALASVCSFACADATSAELAQAAPRQVAAAAVRPPASKPPPVALAAAPRIDLLSNRYRWHLHGPAGTGLVVAAASEGFRKYSNEYVTPWGDIAEVDGRRGRELRRSRAILQFPWRRDWRAGDQAQHIALAVHGLARGQRFTLQLNGKHLGNLSLDGDGGWQQVVAEVPTDRLRDGENELVLFARRSGRVAGKKAYALVHSISIGAAPAADAPWPGVTPVASVAGSDALVGERMTAAFEVPEQAFLTFRGVGEGKLEVSARDLEGGVKPLFAGPAGGSEQVSLKALSGQLVELELRATPGAGFADAAIALRDVPASSRPPAYKNAILLVVDAMRADKLRVYEPKTRVKTPRMSAAIAERGVTMRYNQAASPSSPPSHASIQTGMIPRVHGVVGDNGKLFAGTPMISTVLGEAGAATAYYGNNPFGMARLEKPGQWTEFHQPLREGKSHDCKPLVKDMLDFAGRQSKAGRRFFISSLPYEPHTPYRYHPGITEQYYAGSYEPPVGKSVDGVLLSALADGKQELTDEQWKELFALYDGEVEYWDGCFGELSDGLAALGILDDTVVIITADHGEGMFEHGHGGHAWGHYAELANVPFVILAKGLGHPGQLVRVATSHLDIAPTIVDLLGVGAEARMQGRTVVPLILRDGPWVPRVVSLEYGRSYALRATRYKYIVDYQQNESAFDLVVDPQEKNNLIDGQPVVVRYLRDMAGFFLAHRSSWKAATMGDWNNHTKGFLEYLGVSN